MKQQYVICNRDNGSNRLVYYTGTTTFHGDLYYGDVLEAKRFNSLQEITELIAKPSSEFYLGFNVIGIADVTFKAISESKELFEEILTEMSENPIHGVPQVIREKIASMACKAAVKGNHTMSSAEAEKLIEKMLQAEEPYHCPHGRPTTISMSQKEFEKKFKRIV